ncbi:MAG TPA: amidohydrolase family protein [Candidatus Binatia bacterium]|jgi:aminocarboxymuconate-semialdehyde decarboxylase|nr:amidohydrolase family protein [Candidatus Binatia bacterium]
MPDRPSNTTDIIDVHAHIYPEGCFTEVLGARADFKLLDNPRGQSLLYRGSHVMSMPAEQDNLPKRLASMDSAGIGLAILSVGALNIGWAGARDALAARFVNDGLAAVCRQHPARFRFVAVLPCTSHAEMVSELERALDMGAAGVGIATNIGDIQLHAPELRAFWQEMNRRRLMVLVHPTCPCDAPQNDPGTFLSVGYPGETAMAATKLALSGVLKACPDVKIVWSHLGGGLPMILDRIDRGYQRYSACPQPPSYYLRRCYFDTACTHGPALECARATWGVNALIFGSDVPHVPNTEKETIAALKARSWPDAELKAVFGGTVRGLLA